MVVSNPNGGRVTPISPIGVGAARAYNYLTGGAKAPGYVDSAVKWIDSLFTSGSSNPLINFANSAKPVITGSFPNATKAVTGAADTVADAVGNFDFDSAVKKTTASRGSGSSYSPVVPEPSSAHNVDYLFADLASYYGMPRETAYGEALQNTQYLRAVADLKRAGLNPVLAAGKVSPAGSYVYSGTLSGGSGSGSSGYHGSYSSSRMLSSEAYNLVGVIGSLVGGLAGAAVSKGPYKLLGLSTGSMYGKQIAQQLVQGAGSLNSLLK